MAFAEWLHTTVLWPGAYRQIVLTIPKMLRASFRYDRHRLGGLCGVAAEVLVASFRVLLNQPEAERGLVECVRHRVEVLSDLPALRGVVPGDHRLAVAGVMGYNNLDPPRNASHFSHCR